MKKRSLRAICWILTLILVLGLFGQLSGANSLPQSPSDDPTQAPARVYNVSTGGGAGCIPISYNGVSPTKTITEKSRCVIYYQLLDGYKWPETVTVTGASFDWFPASAAADVASLVIYNPVGDVKIDVRCVVDSSGGQPHAPTTSGQLFGMWQFHREVVHAGLGECAVSAKVWTPGNTPDTLVAIDVAGPDNDIEFNIVEAGDWIIVTDETGNFAEVWYIDFGSDPITVSAEFWQWFTQNADLIDEDGLVVDPNPAPGASDELLGRWLLNETLDETSIEANLGFASGNTSYTSLSRSDASTDTLTYGSSSDSIACYTAGKWSTAAYRVIAITDTSRLTNREAFAAWLKANATKDPADVSDPDPTTPSEPDPTDPTDPTVPTPDPTDELLGTWIFKDEITYSPARFDFSFHDASSYSYMGMTFTPPSDDWELSYDPAVTSRSSGALPDPERNEEDIIFLFAYSSISGWSDVSFKTIIITDTSALTNRDEFTTWLKANATKRNGFVPEVENNEAPEIEVVP